VRRAAPLRLGPQTLGALLANIAEIYSSRLSQVQALQLHTRLRRLELRVEELENTKYMVVPVQSLEPEPYELIKPLRFTVRSVEEAYVASFDDATLSATGDSVAEAVENLKDIMLTTYDILIGSPHDSLGVVPTGQLAVLSEFLRKRENGHHHQETGARYSQETRR